MLWDKTFCAYRKKCAPLSEGSKNHYLSLSLYILYSELPDPPGVARAHDNNFKYA